MQIHIKEEVFKKDIASLDKKIADQCVAKIKTLKDFPQVSNLKQLKGIGQNIYRLRSGDYRILFSVNGDKKIITIFAIKHRKDVYKYVHSFLKLLNS